MKRLSLQWRITLLTALLIACACVCMNLLLYRTGVTGMDALNGFMMQYQPGSADSLTIEIPQEEMSSLLAHFSQEVYDAKVVFGRKGWCITAVVTILSAAIAYFVSGRALKPLQQLAQNCSGSLRATPPTSCALRWLFCRQSWNCLQRSTRPWTPKLPG